MATFVVCDSTSREVQGWHSGPGPVPPAPAGQTHVEVPDLSEYETAERNRRLQERIGDPIVWNGDLQDPRFALRPDTREEFTVTPSATEVIVGTPVNLQIACVSSPGLGGLRRMRWELTPLRVRANFVAGAASVTGIVLRPPGVYRITSTAQFKLTSPVQIEVFDA